MINVSFLLNVYAYKKLSLLYFASDYWASNISLPTPQTGHVQSSGISSKDVPGAIPESASPTAGSYT